jgi:hypothetical protein
VLVGHFRKPYTEQVVGDEWDVMNLTGSAGCYSVENERMVEETR